MELRQLRYFVALAEERHFGRAAQRLGIATPTLSQQLRVLERGLGVVLVDRTRAVPVALTPAGEVLLQHARVILTRADRAREEVRDSAEQPVQVLVRVAPGAQLLLAPQLRLLTDDATFGVVTMTSSTSDALLAVREESSDAAVVWDGQGDRHGLTTTVLREVPVHLALPAGHRLADAAAVRVSELARETVVMFPRTLSPNLWDLMCHHVLPKGALADQVVIEAHALGPLSVLRKVAGGEGVAPVIAPLAAQQPHHGTVIVPLDPPLLIPLELAWRTPAGPALQRVISVLRSGTREAVPG